MHARSSPLSPVAPYASAPPLPLLTTLPQPTARSRTTRNCAPAASDIAAAASNAAVDFFVTSTNSINNWILYTIIYFNDLSSRQVNTVFFFFIFFVAKYLKAVAAVERHLRALPCRRHGQSFVAAARYSVFDAACPPDDKLLGEWKKCR